MLNFEEMCRARELISEVKDKALEVEMHYVMVLFRGPITRHIERRWGLFESSTEADIFYKMLRDTFEDKIKVPYWIDSSVSWLGMQDHGLLTNSTTDDDSFMEDLMREQREQM